MTDTIDAARRYESTGARHRQKGDALRDRGDDAGARAAYEGALGAFDAALRALGDGSAGGADPEPAMDAGAAAVAADLYGGRGGLLRRLDRLGEAVESYRAGAAIEQGFGLPTTYNRANAIKLGLLTGATTLAEARPGLVELRDTLAERVRTDEQAADDPWVWADLADCTVLLGDTAGAIDHYRVFGQRAQTRSPVTTLAVLRELSAALTARGDPEAAALAAAVTEVEAALGLAPT